MDFTFNTQVSIPIQINANKEGELLATFRNLICISVQRMRMKRSKEQMESFVHGSISIDSARIALARSFGSYKLQKRLCVNWIIIWISLINVLRLPGKHPFTFLRGLLEEYKEFYGSPKW